MQIRLRENQQHRVIEHGVDIEHMIVEQAPAEEHGDRKPHESAVKRRSFDKQHHRLHTIDKVRDDRTGAAGTEQFKDRVVEVSREQPARP